MVQGAHLDSAWSLIVSVHSDHSEGIHLMGVLVDCLQCHTSSDQSKKIKEKIVQTWPGSSPFTTMLFSFSWSSVFTHWVSRSFLHRETSVLIEFCNSQMGELCQANIFHIPKSLMKVKGEECWLQRESEGIY